MTPADPLILTARFDAHAAGTFQALRDAHFPAALNIVPAHCTLFHRLPGEQRGAIAAVLATACARVAPMPFATAGLRFLGRGVALNVEAAGLAPLRGVLATTWADTLTPQDHQPFRPHVTIQNKADPAGARALFDRLAGEAITVTGTIVGLDLWAYRGGPWEAAAHLPFAA